jgi:hypothetical protein
VKDKLWAFKLNSLWKHKHSGRKQTLIAILGIYKVGEFYMKKYSIHAKNEHLYPNVKKNTIANWVFCDVATKRKNNWSSVLFVFTWYLRTNL